MQFTNKKEEATVTSQATEQLEVLAKVLLRCWILGYLLLLFWFGVCMLCGNLVYATHSRMFGLTVDQLRVIHYCGMGLLKLAVSLFFFIPWISIRMTLKQGAH